MLLLILIRPKVFNVDMYGYGKAFTKISSEDLEHQSEVSELTIENAKYRIINEFIQFILGNITLKDVKSNIDTHVVPVKMMSGVCQSSAKMHTNTNPLINIQL